jgi:hypothetical protein
MTSMLIEHLGNYLRTEPQCSHKPERRETCLLLRVPHALRTRVCQRHVFRVCPDSISFLRQSSIVRTRLRLTKVLIGGFQAAGAAVRPCLVGKNQALLDRSARAQRRAPYVTISALVVTAMTIGGILSGCAPTRTSAPLPSEDCRTIEPPVMLYEIRKPRNLIQLLSNLERALKRDLLLRRSFYTDDNIQRLSGASEIHWGERTSSQQYVWASGFDGMTRKVRVGSNMFEGVSYSITWWVADAGKCEMNAYVSLMGSNPDVSFEQVEKLLGTNWLSYPLFPYPADGRGPAPPTDPHGNARIRYDFNSAGVSRSIVLEFHADGTLYDARVSERMN